MNILARTWYQDPKLKAITFNQIAYVQVPQITKYMV